ncbi:hypothetical protein [Micromonospora parathelypteridis]|uniref:Uncharacterized protein n=1 Tax=Micromonospora parathelypteridis TaxID=1839617 RepID=A0A840VS11_9ACTN|nr:hypothetical protein [Micromonospora parathelypteridis]MBB5479447.1 hypothetical protein [Micromonospora parathelypteridis]GGO29967.1 hypothetical protein GCM10011576_57080 [Micromonospora parathelypteridis]
MSVLLTLTALAGLSACTPADKPLTALRVVDGQPVLVVAECAVFTATRIAVFNEGTPTGKWAIEREGTEELAAVTLLQPPPGWKVAEQSLVALEPDTLYAVTAYGSQNDAAPIDFTLGEVTRLGPDQVLVNDGGTKRKAITETAFRDRAKKAC